MKDVIGGLDSIITVYPALAPQNLDFSGTCCRFGVNGMSQSKVFDGNDFWQTISCGWLKKV